MSRPPVAPGNAEQLAAWDGAGGDLWAVHAADFDRVVARYTAPFLDAAGIGPTDAVLDIGCGTGSTACEAARRAPAGSVLGVDLSAAMLEVARRAAARAGLDHVRFLQADVQVHPFPPASFDVAISRTGAMFFADPVAAFTGVAAALRPGGRLALLVWRAATDNEWFREVMTALGAGREVPVPPPGAPGPFSLADPDHVRGVLTAAGFADPRCTGRREPVRYGDDADGACAFLTAVFGWRLDGLDEAGRQRALADLRRTVEAHRHVDGPGGVEFGSAMWLVTARRP